MNTKGSGWPEERIEKLKSLHKRGFSCSIIAYELGGVTRNAVIGKLHRLGLSNASSTVHRDNQFGRPKKPRRPREKTVRIVRANGNSNRMRLFETAKIEVQQLRCAEVDPLNLGLIDLDPHQCRYPVNNASPFLFCGHTKMEGASYCAPHFMLAHRSEADRLTKKLEAA